MKRLRLSLTPVMLRQAANGVLAVAGTTALLLLIGRNTLGEAVIALLYLVPIGWSASRWGQVAGLSAAVTAGLAFNFLFIPPFYTFVIGSLEGYLVWGIFLAVALIVVGRIQAALARAQASEHEALVMYELSAALARMRTQAAVAHTLAQHLQQFYQAAVVKVVVHDHEQAPGLSVAEPPTTNPPSHPDRVLPIWNAWGLTGEIQIWRGAEVALPPTESRLLQNFTSQAGQALERTRLMELEDRIKAVKPLTSLN